MTQSFIFTFISIKVQHEEDVDSFGCSHVGTRLFPAFVQDAQCGHTSSIWDNCPDQNKAQRGDEERSSWLPSGNIFGVPVNRIQFLLCEG